MDVRNCRGCGRLFNYLQGPHLCPACMQKLEEKFSQVKDYLEDNPHATIPEIAKDNDVSTRQIEQWVREDMANTFQNAYQKKEAPKPKSSRVISERDKMRYLDR